MTTTRNDLEIRNLVADVFKHGGKIQADEPAATRRRPGFSAFVLWPALVFGGVTLTGTFGLITVIFAAGVKSGAWGEWGYWRLSLGLSAFVAAIVSGWVLVVLTNDWRDLQWQYRKLEIDAKPARVLQNDREIQIEQTGPRKHVQLLAKWKPGWQARLAKRTHDRHGEWTAGDNLTRNMLHGLVSDLNNQFKVNPDGKVTIDLKRLGWISDDDRREWTDKGREDLRGKLFYGGNDE